MREDTLEISGNKTRIENHSYRNLDMKKVIISARISEIGHRAFKTCTSLESVTLPDSLEIIEREAFAKSTSLKEINMPNSVKKICIGAFHMCESLQFIRLPDSIEMEMGIIKCHSLKRVSLPFSLLEKGYNKPMVMNGNSRDSLTSIEVRL